MGLRAKLARARAARSEAKAPTKKPTKTVRKGEVRTLLLKENQILRLEQGEGYKCLSVGCFIAWEPDGDAVCVKLTFTLSYGLDYDRATAHAEGLKLQKTLLDRIPRDWDDLAVARPIEETTYRFLRDLRDG